MGAPTSSPKSFLIRDDILGSPRGLWHPLRGHSWPDAIFYVVHVDYYVLSKVNRDQMVIWVYDVLSEVILDRTIFYEVHVEYDVLAEVNRTWRDSSLGSPRVLWRRLQGQSWPDDVRRSPRGLRRPLRSHSRSNAILYVVHVYLRRRLRGQSWPYDVLRTPRGLRRPLRSHSWPDDI